MLGFRRATIHLALIALLLRAFLPAGWMPGGPGDAPLVMCSVMLQHAATDGKAPVKPDNSADGQCAFAASAVMAAPEILAFSAPSLTVYDRQDETALALRALPEGYSRPAPRGPPTLT